MSACRPLLKGLPHINSSTLSYVVQMWIERDNFCAAFAHRSLWVWDIVRNHWTLCIKMCFKCSQKHHLLKLLFHFNLGCILFFPLANHDAHMLCIWANRGGKKKRKSKQRMNNVFFMLFITPIPENLRALTHNIPTLLSPLLFICLSCILNCQNDFVTVAAKKSLLAWIWTLTAFNWFRKS